LSQRKATKVFSQEVRLADIDSRAKERAKKNLFYHKHGFKTIQGSYGIKRSTLLEMSNIL
jgi:virulence-associated protein VapD